MNSALQSILGGMIEASCVALPSWCHDSREPSGCANGVRNCGT